ncbi:hypothetical protein An11g04910 [Aspergillus niger]|uniref:Uncharacterized protein n=2 Tax=Aspergillus niger TaxID=5061 RepID=A2QWE9_ASPNC|nr:hypothetical protein An11g04910 [Aspergillus niger]CAK40695.1 hypothetical protein An11g04910 [Aspergillus niger]
MVGAPTVKRWSEGARLLVMRSRLLLREALWPTRSDSDPWTGPKQATNYQLRDTFICAPQSPEHGERPIVRSCDCLDRHGNDRPGSRTSLSHGRQWM